MGSTDRRARPSPLGAPTRFALQRLRSSIGGLLAVSVVAALTASIVLLGALVVDTAGRGGVGATLAAAPDGGGGVAVTLFDVRTTLGDAAAVTRSAIGEVLGAGVPLEASTVGATPPLGVDDGSAADVRAYFAEPSDVAGFARVTAGSAPDAAGEALLPTAAGSATGVGPGDRVAVDPGDGRTVVVTVTGLYEPVDPDGAAWAVDILGGNGYAAETSDPDGRSRELFALLGPLVVAPGALDDAGLPVRVLRVGAVPVLDAVTGTDLAPLAARLEDASVSVARATVGGAGLTSVDTPVLAVVERTRGALDALRAGIAAAGAVLLLGAGAVLARLGRLAADAGAGDRALLRIRGVSRAQTTVAAVSDAVLVGLVVALIAPVTATVAHRLLVAPAVLGGVAGSGGPWPEAGVWTGGALLGLLAAAVLLAASAGRSADGMRRRRRQAAAGALARSGADLVVVALAVVAFQQLATATGADAASPVALVAPALLLAAGALLAGRAVAPLRVAAEAVARRARSVVVALAAWDSARRARETAAAVTVLTLVVGACVFAVVQLGTWSTAQAAQAAVAVGPPVRVAAADGATAAGPGEPVLRRAGSLAPSAEASGALVRVLGLSAGARALLDRAPVADVGGATIAGRVTTTAAAGTPLPAGTVALEGSVVRTEGDDSAPFELRLIVQDADGSVRTLPALDVGADVHALTAAVDAVGAVEVVGLRLERIGDGEPVTVGAALGSLTAVTASGERRAVDLAGVGAWTLSGSEGAAVGDGIAALTVSGPPGVDGAPASAALTAWDPAARIPAVLSSAAADAVDLRSGGQAVLRVQGARLRIAVAGVVPAVPGAIPIDRLGLDGSGPAADSLDAIVLDGAALGRAIALAGVADGAPDERWAGNVTGPTGTAVTAAALTAVLQDAPLRAGIPVVLRLVAIGTGLLALAATAVQVATTARTRRLETAHLRAAGMQRSEVLVLRVLGALLVALPGVLLGTLLGLAVAVLAGPPLVAGGTSPVPEVRVAVPWAVIGALDAGLVAAICATAVLVGVLGRPVRPAELLRAGAAA